MLIFLFLLLETALGVLSLVCGVLLLVYALPPSRTLTKKEKESKEKDIKWSGILLGAGIGGLLVTFGAHHLLSTYDPTLFDWRLNILDKKPDPVFQSKMDQYDWSSMMIDITK